MKRPWWVLVGLPACADPEPEMRLAVQAGNDAIATSLAVGEVLRQGTLPPNARHTGGGQCPSTSAVGSATVYTLTLDYGTEGCFPDSGWLAVPVAGHVWLNVDPDRVDSATFDLVRIGGHLTDGSFGGLGSASSLTASGSVSFDGTEWPIDVELDFSTTTLTLNGTVDTPDGAVRLEDVHFTLDGPVPSCPVPDGGQVVFGDKPEITVPYLGTERVVVQRRSRTLEVELCERVAMLFEGWD